MSAIMTAEPAGLLLEAFERWRLADVAAAGTILRYRRGLRALARHGLTRLSDVTRERFVAFQDARQREGIAQRSVNGDLAALVTLLRWLVKRGEAARSSLDEVTDLWLPVPTQRVADYYTRGQFEAIRIRAHGWFRLAFEMACLTGLRLDELRRVEREDLDLGERPMLRVRVTKTGRERMVSLCSEIAAILRREAPTRGPLFPSDPLPWTRARYRCKDTFQRAMREASRASGWRCTFHRCRRTFCTWLLRSGRVSPPEVANMMGHCDLTMIMRCYYVFLTTWNPGIEGLAEGGFAEVLPPSARRRGPRR